MWTSVSLNVPEEKRSGQGGQGEAFGAQLLGTIAGLFWGT